MQLVIAEKPSVARSIANVLGVTKQQDGYLEGNNYIVSWCIGHLVELAQPQSYGEQWKSWTYESLPVKPEQWNYEIKKDTKQQYKVLHSLLHNKKVDTVVCATDAGREGELIFRLVYEMAECKKPIKRLWISSMEESAIKEGFENLKPGSDYDNLYYSALCRQEADWLVGINGTRLFTVLYGGKVLKVGRVQTPTLAMLVERETKIMEFQKEPYFVVHILSEGMDAASEKISSKEEAEQVAETCKLSGQAIVKMVVKEEKKVSPPKLYDLTTLQRDANRLFSFTAKQTLEYTQSLYEKKFITYPRTDSQYLSDDMEKTAEDVVKAIFDTMPFVAEVMFQPNIKNVLNSKKVTDHHAIIPTVQIKQQDLTSIPETERKILSLIANRLLCATSENYIYETVKVELSCSNRIFTASSKSVVKQGFKILEEAFKHSFKTTEIEEKEQEEKNIPKLEEGMTLNNIQAKVSSHCTTPPKHYTEDSLLSAMEKAGSKNMGEDVERKGLGTPATRADMIEKLVKDGFVKREKKELLPTEEGMKLITILPDMIKSPQLTADWENALTLVAKGEMKREDFMAGIEELVEELVQTYHEVAEEDKKMFEVGKERLGICPNCKSEVVKGKFGAYCTKKCGMNVSRVLGVTLTDEQVKSMLLGKKILLKGLQSKKGTKYDAYIIPDGVEEYNYVKDGREKSGKQYKFKMEFSNKNKK